MVDLSETLEILTLIFISSSILLLFLKRFSHPPMLAYILTGILISPLIPQEEIILLSEIGIAFLVFIFGVKLDPERLKSVARESQFSTTVEVVVIGGLAMSFGVLIGLSTMESLYLSIFAALSSSLVGLELIEDELQLDLIHGRLAESIQLIQDVVAIAAIVAFTSVTGGSNLLQHSTSAIFLLLSAIGIRNYLFDWLASLIDESRELLMISSVALLAGFIGVSQGLGLNMVVGSFAAGLSVAKFPHNIEILDTTGSVKDFFSAIFFVSLGALMSIPSMRGLVIAGGLIFLTSVAKPAVTVLSLMKQGFDDRTSHLTGFSLDQISEFSLILGITGYVNGSISGTLFNALVIAATSTMVISAYTTRHEERLYKVIRRLWFIPARRKIPDSGDLEELEDHIVLIGYDTQGKRIAEALKEEDAEFIVIENDPEKIEELRKKGEKYVYGDVMDQEPWERALVKEASLVFSTIPLRKVSDHIIGIETDADTILRADSIEDASEMLSSGAIYVNVPEVVSSELLVDHIEGVLDNVNYREELRRRSLLEIRRYLTSEEG